MTIFGAGHLEKGQIVVEGQEVDLTSPQGAIAAGLGYVPEDRKLQGLFLGMALRSNITAASIKELSNRFGFVEQKKESEMADYFVKALGIRTPSIEQKARNLSGGNQQKVVLAKWMAVNPKVLIMDEPTRGVDVGAKAEIYALMREMAQKGMAIIMISSELPEVLSMSDRIVVMRERKYAGTLDAADADEEIIMAYATGTTIGA
jgi:ABC-type sugar transport system ATPase subunit